MEVVLIWWTIIVVYRVVIRKYHSGALHRHLRRGLMDPMAAVFAPQLYLYDSFGL